MKTSLSLLGIVATVGLLSACSDDSMAGGTGGVPSNPTGGTTSTGGTTGAGGTATGGTTGAGGGGNSISINGAWVPMDGNTVGIQGAFFILEDSVKDGAAVEDSLTHTDFTADSDPVEEAGVSKFGPMTDKPCISGTAAQVTTVDGMECNPAGSDCDWDDLWGGGIGLSLNETGGDDSVKSPFDADAAGISGFQFTVSGDAAGATIRFKATDVPNDGEDFCAKIVLGQENQQVTFDQLKHMCWGADGTKTLDTTQLMQLQWQIVTDASGSYPVTNFCIENLAWF